MDEYSAFALGCTWRTTLGLCEERQNQQDSESQLNI